MAFGSLADWHGDEVGLGDPGCYWGSVGVVGVIGVVGRCFGL